ncbi:MAG TPA: hypothetical protein VHA56_05775 [Mucilaginibacter sp.]|nr:hypothetical protein [Mucilaginibacter sp.]
MMQTTTTILHLKLLGVTLIIAPLMFSVSTFFWENGEYGITAGTLMALSNVFWIPALIALFGLLKSRMPYYYAWGLLLAIYGSCVGGGSFSYLGYFATVFHISHQSYLTTLMQHPFSSGILIFWAGPVFPLSLLVLGINLIRKKAVTPWLGMMLCLGAVAFPLGRIFRIEMIAHVTDLLFTIPFVITGLQFINRPDQILKKMEIDAPVAAANLS